MSKRRKATSASPGGRAKRSSATGTIVLTTLGVCAAGVVGYLVWQYRQKRRSNADPNLDDALLRNPASPGTSTPIGPLPGDTATPPFVPPVPGSGVPPLPALPPIPFPGSTGGGQNPASGDFPLKKGSKGANVRALQDALIRKHGRGLLPKYGADGDFGTETINALKKIGMPAIISETLFNVLVQGGGGSGRGEAVDHAVLGTNLYKAALRKDFSGVMSLLRKIRSSSDYSSVSESFKRYRLGGVRQTLVNGLLNTFKSASQKEQLRLAFASMGLTYDGSKWSLSGIDGIPIMTIKPARIWLDARTAYPVRARTILGQEVARRLQYVLFANRGRYFLVRADCVQQL